MRRNRYTVCMQAAQIPLPTAEQTANSLAQSHAPWQQAMREAVRSPAELLDLLGLPETLLPDAERAAALFKLCVPRSYVRRMRPGDPHDPLLRQVLPLADELQPHPGYVQDAVGDLASAQAGGLLHKYHGRALLITTGACAVHCRYCFRRHFPYSDINSGRTAWRDAVAAVQADPSLEEIILSGGDPLSLSDRRLRELSSALNSIAHVRRLRIHTRTPVVLPERVDDALLAWLGDSRAQVIMVIHANHAQELDDEVGAALARIAGHGITLLNQSVLLRGVNDHAQVLADLSKRLFKLGVLPYYLHLPDKVANTGHFDIQAAQARVLWKEMAGLLPGYLVPRLAHEEAGEPSKTLLGF